VLEVMLVEHSSKGVNHASSSAFSLPFSDRDKMALEKSLAIGEPFWNICIERQKRIFLFSFVVDSKGRDREGVATHKAQSSKSGGGSGANVAVAVLIEENFLVWEFKEGSRYIIGFKFPCVIVFAGDVQDVVWFEPINILQVSPYK